MESPECNWYVELINYRDLCIVFIYIIEPMKSMMPKGGEVTYLPPGLPRGLKPLKLDLVIHPQLILARQALSPTSSPTVPCWRVTARQVGRSSFFCVLVLSVMGFQEIGFEDLLAKTMSKYNWLTTVALFFTNKVVSDGFSFSALLG